MLESTRLLNSCRFLSNGRKAADLSRRRQAVLIQTALVCRYSSMCCAPDSRPQPMRAGATAARFDQPSQARTLLRRQRLGIREQLVASSKRSAANHRSLASTLTLKFRNIVMSKLLICILPSELEAGAASSKRCSVRTAALHG